MSEKNADQLSPETIKMAAAITAAIERTEGDLCSNKIGKEPFKNTLPEGMTDTQVKDVLHHITNYGAAAVDATGRDAIATFKKHKDLAVVNYTLDLPGRGNEISVQAHRRREKINPQDPKGDAIITHGHLDFKLKLAAGNAKSGEIGRARRMIRELGKTELS